MRLLILNMLALIWPLLTSCGQGESVPNALNPAGGTPRPTTQSHVAWGPPVSGLTLGIELRQSVFKSTDCIEAVAHLRNDTDHDLHFILVRFPYARWNPVQPVVHDEAGTELTFMYRLPAVHITRFRCEARKIPARSQLSELIHLDRSLSVKQWRGRAWPQVGRYRVRLRLAAPALEALESSKDEVPQFLGLEELRSMGVPFWSGGAQSGVLEFEVVP